MIAGFVRGLSTRDVEATLAEALGPQAALSRSTVSRICAQLAEEFTAWSTRRLDEVELDYLYLDATSFCYHPGARAEPVLVAYASPPPARRSSSAWPRPAAKAMTPGRHASPT